MGRRGWPIRGGGLANWEEDWVNGGEEGLANRVCEKDWATDRRIGPMVRRADWPNGCVRRYWPTGRWIGPNIERRDWPRRRRIGPTGGGGIGQQ